MKLIHCADLHLDSPLESNFPPEKAKERRNEILSAFQRLVELADCSEVSAILIAGDLFDSARTTRRTTRYVLDLIAGHPDLYFFYLSGNHDTDNRWLSDGTVPENLKFFGNEWTSYRFGDVTIIGSESPDPETLAPNPNDVNILLLHGQERRGNGTAEKDVVPLAKYKNRNLDYLALGHIHSYRAVKLDDRGTACYCGCPEGRGFDECGEKGYVLLETESGRIRHRFVPFAKRTLHDLSCDLTDCRTQPEIEGRVNETVSPLPAKDLVHLALTGELPPEFSPDLTRIRQLLSDRFYFAKVSDRTRLLIRPDDYRLDVSLKGEFVRRVLSSDKLSDAEKQKIILCGIRALAGEEPD